jgi:hypothetical protein
MRSIYHMLVNVSRCPAVMFSDMFPRILCRWDIVASGMSCRGEVDKAGRRYFDTRENVLFVTQFMSICRANLKPDHGYETCNIISNS